LGYQETVNQEFSCYPTSGYNSVGYHDKM